MVAAHPEFDALPVGLACTDALGTIAHVNAAFAELIGIPAADLVGRNILDFGVGDSSRYSDLIDFASGYSGSRMGPVSVRYRDARGRIVSSDLWAINHLDDPDVGVLVLVFVPEQSKDAIANAVSSVAENAPIDRTLELLAEGLCGNPFEANGCWLVRDAEGQRLVGGAGLLEAVRVGLAKPGPWWRALRTGVLVSVDDISDTSDEYHRLLQAAGVNAWWLLPVRHTEGGIDAGLIVTRPTPGTISPNQLEHLERMVAVAGLAFERTTMQARLTHAAFHDPLTGAGNRERFFAHPDRMADGWALLYIDLDRFKPVNDRFGHAAGDLVLVTVTERIKHAVRPGDRVTRMGGDEFVVECADVGTDAVAGIVADRIIASISQPITLEAGTVEVGASIGIVRSTVGTSVDALLERADAALYRAKSEGRGRWALDDGSSAETRPAP